MRTLLLSYHFPPIGGSGTQRAVKLARYLPEFGHDVTVLTGGGTSVDHWTPADDTLMEDVPDTEIRRLTEAEPDPAWCGGWPSRLERWLGTPSPWTRWWIEGAYRYGLVAGEQADVIVATMSPYSSATAAARLSRALGRPWVADLRDPWALDEMTIYPTVLHRRRELRRMRRLLRTAAAVVANTPEAAIRIRQLLGERRDVPVLAIPNGFDRADFSAAPPERDRDVFRIVHTGHLHTELGREQRRARLRRALGGEVRGVDLLTRSHVYLLEAIDRVVARAPAVSRRIELILAGALSAADLQVATRSPLVRIVGYQSHGAAVALMRSADLLFLPMQNLRPGKRATIVPGKTYEYLAAGPPILAAVPSGDARDLLLEAGTAHVCAPDDVEGMAGAIESELRGTSALRPGPPRELLERIERRTLAADFASVLDAVIQGRRNGTRRTPHASRGLPEQAPTRVGR